MPRYRDNFKLDVNDIELIEQALRDHAARTQGAATPCPRAVQDLLGRLHAQKIFYSHSAQAAAPNG